MLKLRDDWKAIVTKAWSIRLIALAGVLTGVEAVLPIIGPGLPLTDLGLGAVTMLVVAGAFWSRLVAQDGLK